MSRTRILIADDHEMFREAIRRMLEAEDHLEVVGVAGDGETLLGLARRTPADILLLDLDMPGLSGLETLRQLARTGIAIRTIILTGCISEQEAEEALRLGVRGIVGKEAPLSLLVKSIHHVVAGKYWVSHERTAAVLETLDGRGRKSPTRPADILTPRERELVAAVVRAESNQEMSARLGITPQTVKNTLSRVFAKLGVANRLELALFALNQRLIPPSPDPAPGRTPTHGRRSRRRSPERD